MPSSGCKLHFNHSTSTFYPYFRIPFFLLSNFFFAGLPSKTHDARQSMMRAARLASFVENFQTCCSKNCRVSFISSNQKFFCTLSSSAMSILGRPAQLMLFSMGMSPMAVVRAIVVLPPPILFKIHSKTRIFCPNPGQIYFPSAFFRKKFT